MSVAFGKNDSAQTIGGGGVLYSSHNGFMVLFIFGLISHRCFENFVFPHTGGSNPNSLSYRYVQAKLHSCRFSAL